jgi:toxin ParE1/3/4
MADARLIHTPAAEQDLVDIWATIALYNRVAADRIYDDFWRRAKELKTLPELGRDRSEIAEGIRALNCRDYLILYRILPDMVEIVRVVHGARDLNSLF